MSSELPDTQDSIAIIGMSGRFPGARTLDLFWQNLCDGVESVAYFSDEEVLAAGGDPALLSDPRYVKARAILDEIELFDAAFFGYTPREAEIMDPQQRLFLECAWTALENAGYDSETYTGAISVYGGAAMNYYMLANLYPNRRRLADWGDLQPLIGNDKDHLTTRISYKLNLKGPSVTVQTACSTGLVAVCMACQSLLDYQCDIALAGGVSLGIPQKLGYFYSEGGIGSPDGHCRAFDAQGRGTVGGDGVGVVVLKRLDDALADGDSIQAVIRGFATNNDGADKVGYTAPSVSGQAQAITAAHALAGIDPATISYVEAHGTATTLGDPIEIAALTQAFRATTDQTGFCAIGSIKSNIGHLNTAAGIAGLIKTVLALKYKRIPPSLHFQTPNPAIDFAGSPFYVNTQLSAWRAGAGPRRAGVSSFGMGGTNAHVVLEEAPQPQPTDAARPWQLLLLSAKTATALETATANLAAYLDQSRGSLPDIAYTLQVGRHTFAHRRALLCRDQADAQQALMTHDPKRVWTRYQEPLERSIVFMFPGQGAQYVGMGVGLYENEPVFRAAIDRCAELLVPLLGRDLREMLYPVDEGRRTEDESAPSSFVIRPSSALPSLDQTQYAQPALFATEYALAQLWMSWGMQPEAMIGHSFGEYVAACLAGVFSLEDALALAARRGQLMDELPAGAMLSVALPPGALRPLLGARLALAAINGPALCVVSGPVAAIMELEQALAEQGTEHRRLHVEHALHSALVEPILERFTAFVRTLRLHAPRLPYLSSVSGTWITANEATDPHYWAAHLRQTVRFADGIETLLAEPNRVLLEVGPGQTLATLARQQAPDRVVLTSLRHPYDKQPDDAFLLNTLGQLWLAGARVDWPGFYAHERRQRLPLPTYPFERQRYWVEHDYSRAAALLERGAQPRAALDDWFYIPSWQRSAPPDWSASDVPADAADGWLLFLDPAGLGGELMTYLEQRGQRVIGVLAGDAFERLDARRYRMRPRDRADYGRLLAALSDDGPLPRLIIHLWALATPAADATLDAAELEFFSLLYLAQALGETSADGPRRIAIISNQVHAVTGDEDLLPAYATLLGPCLVLPLEYPQLTCRTIDFALPSGQPAALAQLRDQLLGELTADTHEQVVAYRGAHRWVQTTAPQRLAPAPEPQPRLRERGVYLITGGLGGMGLTFADYLARTVHARLVLTTRAAMPARADWETWLAQADALDPHAHAVRAARDLELLGAEVLVLEADVTNPAHMQAVVEQTTKRFGALHGVIHTAGLPSGGLAQLKTSEAAATVLAAKLRGTLVLEAAVQVHALDFLVLCSSLTSLLGGVGQIDYCAANAFLDAFAQRRMLRGDSCTVSINWDGWQAVGMSVDLRRRQQRAMSQIDQVIAQPTQSASLMDDLYVASAGGMLPSEGVEVLTRILGRRRPLPQVIVSTSDLAARIVEVQALTQSRVLEALDRLGAQPSHARPDLATDYVAPETELEHALAQLWCLVLGIERVGIHDNFFALGGHSLLAVQLLSRLRTAFQIELALPALFETPTIAELAEAIETLRWAATDLHTPPEVMAGYSQGDV